MKHMKLVSEFWPWTGLALIWISVCLASPAQAQDFAPHVDFPAGDIPLGVAIADIDGDQLPDVIVAVHEEDRLAIFKNTSTLGMPNLASKVTFGTPRHPQGVTVGDFDGDGKIDVATASSGGPGAGMLSIFPNLSSVGSISLGTPGSIAFPTAHRVRTADLDGDGKRDLVATDNGGQVGVFQNLSSPGNIAFTTALTIPLVSGLRPLALGDIDGDTKADIVITVKNSDEGFVLRNTSTPGAFSFENGVQFSVGDGPEDLFLADVDGDGALDVLTADDLGDGVSILRNTSTVGSISFEPAFTLATGQSPSGVIVADLDGQGGLDIATADSASAKLTVFENLSTPGILVFAPSRSFDTADRPIQLAASDLDSDGRTDIAVTNHDADTLSLFRNVSPIAQPIAPFLVALPIDRNLHTVDEARISAVMDHHVPWEGVPISWQFPYNCATTADCQTAVTPCADSEGRKKVIAFDSQVGDAEFGENAQPPGYRESCAGDIFSFPDFVYAGSISGGTGTCPGGLTGAQSYLDYDGHSGYDFNYAGDSDQGDPILATAAGWLEIPASDFVNAPCTGDAGQYNSLRILHSNGLETWYLHAIEGSECIPFNGSSCSGPDDPARPTPGEMVWVDAGSRIGSVGATGTGSPHLHFEVRQSNTQQPVDPFGCSSGTRLIDPAGCAVPNLWSLVFVDRFETGDTSGWSAVTPPAP